ncbi:MAG: ATP-binding protein [Promethearchaeota archaeon]
MSEAIEKKYKKAAQVINNAGGTPYPVTDTLIKILKHLVDEEYLDFIIAFKKKRSQTMEQLKESSGLSEEQIEKNVELLAKKGLIFNQPNRSGVMVYRIMPYVNVGVFEYTFMKELEDTGENREIAKLFAELSKEGKERLSNNYEAVLNYLKNMRPIDRTIPFETNEATGEPIKIVVNKELEVPEEKIIPSQTIEEIIEKFDDIAVGHCFCRHHHDLLGDPCKQTKIRENCFTFGKSARFTSEQGFARLVSKGEALKIMKASEEDGLVHKAYHPNFDITKDETSICNCCTCCCGQVGNITVNATNYISQIDENLCVGCGTCIEHCHTNSLELNDRGKAERVGEFCIGCGVCAHFCPENAISLVEKERLVRFPPPKPN